MNEAVVCSDGFRMSVQANENAYCDPRINGAEIYTQVEVGFPSEREPLLMSWAENEQDPTGTVYGYVPVSVVTDVIAKHGGIYAGQVPNGVLHLKEVKDFIIDTPQEK